MELPDQRSIAIAVILFSVGFTATFIGLSELRSSNPKPGYSEDVNLKVNASNAISTVAIDEKNLTMMYQDSAEGKFFIDVTNDKQPDREIEIQRDGKIHRKKIFATLEGQTYTLTVEYTDDPEKTGDAYLMVTHAEVLE